MRISILSSAEQELVEAVNYYNELSPGLGYELATEARNTIDRIRFFPKAWPLVSNRTRRCIVNKFPYAVLYQIRQDFILVTAIMHAKRDPKRWQEQI